MNRPDSSGSQQLPSAYWRPILCVALCGIITAAGPAAGGETPTAFKTTGPLFSIRAESAFGSSLLELGDAAGAVSGFSGAGDDKISWELEQPVDLLDPNTGEVVGRLESATVVVGDHVVTLNFIVTSGGSPTSFIVSSANLAFSEITGAVGRATAALQLTDIGGDGASSTGQNPDGQSYQAFYNSIANTPATGTTFATLQGNLSSGPYGSDDSAEDFPLAPGFSSTNESGSTLGAVSSMSAQWAFQVDASTATAGTSSFIITATPPAVTIEAENAFGSARLEIPQSSLDAAGKWVQSEPLPLLDPENGLVVAQLETAEAIAVPSNSVTLNFVVSSGSATVYTVTSASLSFAPIAGTVARASAAVSVTDFDGNGASLTGNNPESRIYQAFYNDIGNVPGTGATFATLIDSVSTATPYSSTSGSAEFAAAGAFSSTAQSGSTLGAVSSISAQFQFQTSAGDSASGTSVFVVGFEATATPSATPTVTETATATPTATETPTSTPVPQGGSCASDPTSCDPGLFCVDDVCCESVCDGELEQCNLSGQEGICAATTSPAPTTSKLGLVILLAILSTLGAVAIMRRQMG